MQIADWVYWNDPDADISSGYYQVTNIQGAIIQLRNRRGSVVEALATELSPPVEPVKLVIENAADGTFMVTTDRPAEIVYLDYTKDPAEVAGGEEVEFVPGEWTDNFDEVSVVGTFRTDSADPDDRYVEKVHDYARDTAKIEAFNRHVRRLHNMAKDIL